jgi:hypothetical protein
MAYSPPVISYATTLNGTYTALTGIQSVSIRRGRQRFQDPFPGTSCVIELIPANSYTTPIEVGQFVDVRTSNAGSAPAFFTGRISDVERNYAIPFDSVTGAAPADRIVITVQGAMGVIGQAGKTSIGYTSSSDVRIIIDGLLTLINVDMPKTTGVSAEAYNFFGVDGETFSAERYQYLDLVNRCCRAGVAYIDDVNTKRVKRGPFNSSFQVNAYRSSERVWTFSDTSTGANIYRFTSLNFLSSAESTFTEIQVSGAAESLGIATENTGLGEPYVTLQHDTQLRFFADMESLAAYLLIIQNESEPTPFSIKTNTVVADGIETKTYMATNSASVSPPSLADWFDQIIGAVVTIEFRGSTIDAIVQGVNSNFYADQANFEFYFAPYLGGAFTLDSAALGVLDTNRLGYP